MAIIDNADFSLTYAQRYVVEKPWDTRALVTAGAGSGKTTTLTYRLEHLTGSEDLEASEILVLSFSRASVRELRDRVDRLAGTGRRVRAQTFDGWALTLLRQADPQRTDLAGLGFDERIELAIDAIEAGIVESFEQGPPTHVIIDEVQDLVGVRREMVEALLDRLADSSGFTVVGDAAQSIYGFQVTDPDSRAEETNRFFGWVRASFAGDLIEVTLDDNFRARTAQARVALPFGKRLQNLPADQAAANAEAVKIHDELLSTLARAPDFGDLNDLFVQDSLRLSEGTTAILCRDNGQVLRFSEQLNKYNIPHNIQRSPRSRPAPAWVADLLLTAGDVILTEERFLEIVSTFGAVIDDPGRVWRSLRRVAWSPRNRLDVGALRRALAEGRLPDELAPNIIDSLVLSTVHRAKGLEFDQVLIVEPEQTRSLNSQGTDASAEARLLYVAMTRSRDVQYRIASPGTWMMRKSNRKRNFLPVDRWYVGGRDKWERKGIEAIESDVCHVAPGGFSDPASDPVEAQRYLRESVHLADEVELLRLHDLPISPAETPPYGIFHDGHPIGAASERFRRDLWRLLKLNRGFEVKRWPQRITGLRIDMLESIAGSVAVTERSGLGDSGVWIAPRLCGLGRFDWKSDNTAEEGWTV
ncbi:AAA family ATPase [Rhodococcus qingshengii]|uniref:UvrD-helicase domain-containing protein n=1 Tax=Rhodococcus qingshengii TaxID=334542 RepID=UPI00211151BA|nr:UvrD-helicase domain-containing protein [Rhodococcus qingshengii]UUE23363.1 AAA family ATPase [Rhodococcus qingshengii]